MPDEPAIGSVLGDYRIDGIVGRGGMGVIYRATQIGLDRTVALKLIAPELASSADFRERFTRESRIAASIEHPNVIPVHEAGEADGMLFIAMRYVEGTDLRALLQREGRLDPERAARMVFQIGDALDAAHARGLVHRDIKPGNVLIAGSEGREHVYLTDFGLSKRVASAGGLTRTGQWVGTLDYVAPEQIQGSGVDARTDVYALGCVLYETLTGRVPFDMEEDVAKMFAHLNEPPPSVIAAVPGLAGELDAVVRRAMAKSPDERHPSAGDLGRAAVAAAEGRAPSRPERSVAAGEAAPAAATVAAASPPTGATAELAPEGVEEAPPQQAASRARMALIAGGGAALALGAAAAVLAIAGVFSGDEERGGFTKRELARTEPRTEPPAAAEPPASPPPTGRTGPQATTAEVTWRPNYRIGTIRFNRPLPADAELVDEKKDGRFLVKMLHTGAIVEGILFADPNSGKTGARNVTTRSPAFAYRGVKVGTHYKEAQEILGPTFELKRGRNCSFLNSFAAGASELGPVSTQLFFDRRSGVISQIALNEITEIDC